MKTKKFKIIKNKLGDIQKVISKKSQNFKGFGELYFSWVQNNYIKAWKKHKVMTLNLVVPFGKVEFLFYDEGFNNFKKIIISAENYKRITVPPDIWFGFKGQYEEFSLVVNCADIVHDPSEVDVKSILDIPFPGD